jgi:hypothetical protein
MPLNANSGVSFPEFAGHAPQATTQRSPPASQRRDEFAPLIR